MSVDTLQEKIRKLKNPSVLELVPSAQDLPPHLLEQEGSSAKAWARFCQEMLAGLKGYVPAVRFSFSAFAMIGPDGLLVLSDALKAASTQGYYVFLDAPEIHSPRSATIVADSIFAKGSAFPCDGLVIGVYPGSDVIKPFLGYCQEGKKDIFAVVRTANKSAPELQDLLAGTRLVHIAATDHINRYGSDTMGKFGYTRVGVMAAASSAESLRTIRSKYPKLFLLLDGYDYPNANAKICSQAFDKFGHGAAVCSGATLAFAWKQTESDGTDYVAASVAAAERMKKNLARYTTVL